MSNKTVTVDVREDIRNGREPFSKIMSAVAALRADEQLLLIAPFEPIPLFGVMEKKGFRYTAQPVKSGDWNVLFTRDIQDLSELPGCRPRDASVLNGSMTETVEVDARGLEPPQPLIKILEAITQLPVGAQVHARTDRRPMHLYAQLDERGFTAKTEEQSDGSFLTQISRR